MKKPRLLGALVLGAGFALAAAPAIAAPPAPASSPGARQLTFAQAIALAVDRSPAVGIAAEAAAGAQARIAGARSRRLPGAHVEGGVDLWNDQFAIVFGPQSIVARDQVTSTLTVSIAQPLTGLAYLSELVGVEQHGADAARAEYDQARLDAAYHAAEAYVRVLEARAAADVAHKSVAQIEAELDRARKLRAADTYNDIDVLRFESAKAAADQAAVRADTASDTAIAALVVALGLHDGEPVDVADDLPSPPPPLAMTLEQAQARALSTRPELHAARDRIAQATSGRRAARDGYYPDVRAVAAYQHLTGFGDFQPSNAAFAGVTLSWSVWDWGHVRDQVREAQHAEARAHLAADALVDQVELDVRRRWLEARAGYDTLGTADTQLKAAEEAYRLQQVRFDAGASTTTDVLDAETDVARARLQARSARYQYFLALVALARSVGDLPSASSSTAGAAR